MAKVLMFASINSFSPEDLTALFEVICTKIIKRKPNDVKKEILLVKGKPAEIEKYQVTTMDIMNMVLAMDVKFDFKINYLEGEEDAPVVIPEGKKSELEEQKKDIKNPELKPALKEVTLDNPEEVVGESKETKTGEPPPPPPFLT